MKFHYATLGLPQLLFMFLALLLIWWLANRSRGSS
jgi:hypothetical protein